MELRQSILVRSVLGLSLLAASWASAGQVDIDTPIPNDSPVLTVDDVNSVIANAVGFLKSVNERGVIAVVDREGHILAVFRMTLSGASDLRISEQATTKARTAAFFQSDNNAFTTRTAQFIVQSNFPPGVRNVDAGPLFGVPFSNFPGSDVQLNVPPAIVFVNGVNAPGPASIPAASPNLRPALQPLVITPLTDDLGGVPLFKNGRAAGGVGVEIDGFGVLALGVPDAGVARTAMAKSKVNIEEQAAVAAANGLAAPKKIRGDKILINGFRFPFTRQRPGRFTPLTSFAAEGFFENYTDSPGTERSPTGAANPAIAYQPVAANSVVLSGARATPTQEFPRQGFVPRFPPRDSPLGSITTADVRRMIQQAANQAALTRAAIRNPIGTPAQVWICVVDLAGNICGSFRTNDATPFSFDVHVQKARTAAFFSSNEVGLSSRAIGFMTQTFYPPGVDKRPPGPLSGLTSPEDGADAGMLGLAPLGGSARLTEISQLLVDRTGPALADLVAGLSTNDALSQAVQLLSRRIPRIRDGRISPLQAALTVDLSFGRPRAAGALPATTIPNGITIFPGGVPIYKNGILVGGLGVSGDGVDQDDLIAFAGQKGFEPPSGVRCDEANEAQIVQTLQIAVSKLRGQFPNLTNGTSAVLDVITARLLKGDILQGLRLPYVKLPRSPNR